MANNLTHKFTNNATTVLLNPLTSGQGSMTIRLGDESKFPNVSTPNFFRLTIERVSDRAFEIVTVTNTTGNLFTIVRGAEDTAPLDFAQGDKVELRWTAGAMDSIIDYVDNIASTTFVHTQSSASAVWTITHNLNKYPNVVVIEQGGGMVFGEIVYTSTNIVTMTFSEAIAGTAFVN